MAIASTVLIILVAALHFWFMVLEMALWTKPLGLKTFHMTPEKAESTKVLAANQGLYNGLLAAGLVFGLLYPHPEPRLHILTFFLYAVVAAGAYGAYSVSSRILWIQAFPAALAVAVLWLSQP